MSKAHITFSTVFLCLILVDAENVKNVLDNDHLSDMEIDTNQKLPYTVRDIGEKRLLNIVVNPIIHNLGQGYKAVESSTNEPVTTVTTTPQPMPPGFIVFEHLSIFYRKVLYVMGLLVQTVAGLFRSIIRFFICTFVPYCGLFTVFGDEMDTVPRLNGLESVMRIIRDYNITQNNV